MIAPLSEWDGFYVVAGSAAGALIGLQFVVMTLIAEKPSANVASGGAAYATPTIIHFSAVLFLSAMLHAPWPGLELAAVVWGLVGFGGVGYVSVVARRIYRQEGYRPVFEDWLFHAVLPISAYVLLAASSFAVLQQARIALFGVAAATLILLFCGIHNAWDSVTHHVLVRAAKKLSEQGPEERAPRR